MTFQRSLLSFIPPSIPSSILASQAPPPALQVLLSLLPFSYHLYFLALPWKAASHGSSIRSDLLWLCVMGREKIKLKSDLLVISLFWICLWEWINVEKMLMKWSEGVEDTEERITPERIPGIELVNRRHTYNQLRKISFLVEGQMPRTKHLQVLLVDQSNMGNLILDHM